MRVLHLLGAREDSGGILTVIRCLDEVLAPQGIRQAVLVHRDYLETRRPPLSYRQSAWLLAESYNHPALLLRALLAYVGLRRQLRHEPVDVLHAHSRGGLLLAVGEAALGRHPVLFSNHAYARRLGLYRWAARRPRLHTSVLTPNMARHYGLEICPGGVHVVSECCADRWFARPPVERRSEFGPDTPVRLVGIGNIVRWKNWHLLLDAIAALTPAERARIRFDHWGPVTDDPDARRYAAELAERGQLAQLGECCRFHGPAPSVEDALRDADWFVLPSTNEPCSVALIEALALGLPALASASGGNLDILRPEATGLLFPPERADGLAQLLQRVLHRQVNPDSPAAIRESVRSRSATSVAAQYLDLYRRMAAASAAR